MRQYYFAEKEYLNYEKNYVLSKDSENYKLLSSNMAQQILKEADGAFKSFFGLLKLAKKHSYDALDIMKKSNVVGLNALYGRGDVDTPVRIRVS